MTGHSPAILSAEEVDRLAAWAEDHRLLGGYEVGRLIASHRAHAKRIATLEADLEDVTQTLDSHDADTEDEWGPINQSARIDSLKQEWDSSAMKAHRAAVANLDRAQAAEARVALLEQALEHIIVRAGMDDSALAVELEGIRDRYLTRTERIETEAAQWPERLA